MNNAYHSIVESVKENVAHYFGRSFKEIISLPLSGSNRYYFRVVLTDQTLIATFNEDIAENEAFFYLADFFTKQGFKVPAIVHIFNNRKLYLQQDLGDTTLFQLLKQEQSISPIIKQYYYQALTDLLLFQFSAKNGLDFSRCYPVEAFDNQAIQWDLNYFKYMFLKLVHVPFDEKKLEQDFQLLIQMASKAENSYFMFRDFQSRNIMVHNQQLFYIDFQGGRRGSVYYDVASLLFDAKAELPFSFRNELVEYYLSQLSKHIKIDTEQALQQYYLFVFIRILQALGAYGYRGIFEQKEHFLKSFGTAFANLNYLFVHSTIQQKLPYLSSIIASQFENPALIGSSIASSKKLTLTITSFSYKNGYPVDSSGNGGGFVFDCRALPNPGKIEHLKHYTGQDTPVKEYMEPFDEVKKFISAAQHLVESSIKKYIERDFEHLMVNFGCTGGQHRSVYCAETLAKRIREKFDIKIVVIHTNQQNWELK